MIYFPGFFKVVFVVSHRCRDQYGILDALPARFCVLDEFLFRSNEYLDLRFRCIISDLYPGLYATSKHSRSFSGQHLKIVDIQSAAGLPASESRHQPPQEIWPNRASCPERSLIVQSRGSEKNLW